MAFKRVVVKVDSSSIVAWEAINSSEWSPPPFKFLTCTGMEIVSAHVSTISAGHPPSSLPSFNLPIPIKRLLPQGL